uniref:MAT1-2-1 n=5 Tax=Cordyceps militaris TaxID=73501 RepID=Q874H7_CORMI|nr:mating-type protein MAT1-2-1 [Cordyceps militaris]AKM95190.1 mating-type protein MAT1-2-1 [Cordyceps militaris]AKM95191.1 mating-type protein MAT1-2-1 [Cordyceps militaris]AKM95192.1 mating-type protein MAT1-2-1 [Cordyceps militaris]AKM95193.1 mating-type protein MAT1-2-1 [Cordyceps militaris]
MDLQLDRTRLQDQELWDAVSVGINPFVKVLSIDGLIYRSLTVKTKRSLAENFVKHVQEPVMFCRDGSGPDRYFLGNPRHLMSGTGIILAAAEVEPIWFEQPGLKYQKATMCQSSLPRKHIKIPRPPNAYILYRRDRHTLVKKSEPHLSNNEVSQVLGKAWNAEPPEVRQRYKEMSERIKKALLERHPQYQYQPRKPSERKRRRKRTQDTESQSSETTSATPDSTIMTGSELSMSPESIM